MPLSRFTTPEPDRHQPGERPSSGVPGEELEPDPAESATHPRPRSAAPIVIAALLIAVLAVSGYVLMHDSRSEYAPTDQTVEELPDELVDMVDFSSCHPQSVNVINLLQDDDSTACRLDEGPLADGSITFTNDHAARTLPAKVNNAYEMVSAWQSKRLLDPNKQMSNLTVLKQEGPSGFFVFAQGGVVFACKEGVLITLSPVKSMSQARLLSEKANLI
ncbi:hypothetical protein KRX51_04295 [Corynebacterium sp. TAE3-ERU12]|uniref:hypothetical protein n=1 Tax=Corynebacterium sp. TAE3-ERU12 TaxID=2849491 RepID=UPI001C448559|nr:hypothetical protein [Corynebacterium sp. TAE3-ERU12]MBV7295139.1 hypothetical protein [Corynebacterium sp. TAE3-ERU12]